MIYFILNETTGNVKIGNSISPERRILALQTGSDCELKMIYVAPGGRCEERELHRRFSKHRVRGEWFQFCDAIRDFVAAQQTPDTSAFSELAKIVSDFESDAFQRGSETRERIRELGIIIGKRGGVELMREAASYAASRVSDEAESNKVYGRFNYVWDGICGWWM